MWCLSFDDAASATGLVLTDAQYRVLSQVPGEGKGRLLPAGPHQNSRQAQRGVAPPACPQLRACQPREGRSASRPGNVLPLGPSRTRGTPPALWINTTSGGHQVRADTGVPEASRRRRVDSGTWVGARKGRKRRVDFRAWKTRSMPSATRRLPTRQSGVPPPAARGWSSRSKLNLANCAGVKQRIAPPMMARRK